MKTRIRRFSETVKMRSSVLNRLRSHRYFSLSLLITTVLAASCFHIWQRVVVLDAVADLSRLRVENAALVDATRKVHSDITALSSSARIQRYASDSLGLEMISAQRLFTLVRGRRQDPKPLDEMATVMAAVKRVAAHIPSVVRTSASAGELPRNTIDSLAGKGAGK